jgi:hypothetical protein
MDRATRYTADRRWPVDNSTSSYGVSIHQVHAASAGSGAWPARAAAVSTEPVLSLDELSILTAWAEAVSEAAAHAPERVEHLLAAAAPGANWRTDLGLPEPSTMLADALEALGRITRAARDTRAATPFDALLTSTNEDLASERTVDQVVRHALLAMLEERRARQPSDA